MAGTTIDHTGETIGSFYLVEKMKEKSNKGERFYKGICIFCGTEIVRTYYQFIRMKDRSYCRCKAILSRHKWSNARLGNIFKGMKKRCYNPSYKEYQVYGGRGIKVCNEWLEDPGSFERWAFENGYSDDLTIDRIDNDKGYEPQNCRWVTRAENLKHTSRTIIIEVDEFSLNLRQWSKKLKKNESYFGIYHNRHGIEKTEGHIRELLSEQISSQPNS